MKKFLFVLCWIVLWAASCSTQPDQATLQPGCESPSEVLSFELDAPTRGYSYLAMLYLPPCYESGFEPGYPTIYLVPGMGGGPGSWLGVGAQEIADQLILAGEVPPFILVTTEATSNDPSGADIYNDLVPYVDANYNTLANRDHRAVAGASLGGSAAYRLAFQHPDTFASAGMFGSGIVNGEDQQVAAWLEAAGPNRTRAFFNSGEQDPLMVERARAMIVILDQAKVDNELIVDEGDHSYVYWGTHLADYFRWVAEDW